MAPLAPPPGSATDSLMILPQMHRALRQNTLNGVTSNEKLSHLFRIILQR